MTPMLPTPNPVPQITTPLTDPVTGNTNVQWWRFWASIKNTLYNVLFSTNGVPNPTQNALNLQAGANVTLTPDQTGAVRIAATAPPLGLETNGAANAVQTLLNLIAGGNITLSADLAGGVTIQAAGGPIGGVNAQNGNYTVLATDDGYSVVHASISAHTYTLPVTPPGSKWKVRLANIGPGELTVTSTPNIDNVSGTNALSLCAAQDIYITTNGTTYFTGRGGPLAGSTITGTTALAGSPLLTLVNKDGTGGAGQCLLITTPGNPDPVVEISSTLTAFSATLLSLDSAGSGIGIAVTMATGQYGGTGIVVKGNGCTGISSTTTAGSVAGSFQSTTSVFGWGAAILCDFYQQYVPKTLATITGASGPTAGATAYASDAKNFHTDLAPVGSVAVGGGTGAKVCLSNGSWVTCC